MYNQSRFNAMQFLFVFCFFFFVFYGVFFFFFKQKTAYEISACLVGSEMCIRDRWSMVHYLLAAWPHLSTTPKEK